MKKLIAIAAALVAFAAVASAQPRAIGLRGGYGAEISYQHTLGENFVEADLGLSGYSFCLSGNYNFIVGEQEGFKFYAGPGLKVGAYTYGGMNFGVSGMAGAEYDFEFQGIPFQVSLDWRPNIMFGSGVWFHWYDIAFALRYRF